MGKAYIGVDIGTCETKLALCESGVVRRVAADRTPDNLIREGKIVSPVAMSEFLRDLALKNKMGGHKQCAYILPAASAMSRHVTLPFMNYDQLRMNLPYEFRDYISGEKDKYFYDFAILSVSHDENGKPAELTVHAAATAKSVIAEAADMFRRAGMKLTAAAPEEFAFVNLLRLYETANPPEDKTEYCLIDLGHSATRINIFSGSVFDVTRIVETGGEALDLAIADTMNIDKHIAREYKHANLNGEQSLPACIDIYRSIALDIMRAVNFYGYNTPDSNITELYLYGGGSKNSFLCDTIQEETGLTIRMISDLMPAGVAQLDSAQLIPAAFGITQY